MIDFFAAAEHTLMKRATLDVSLEVLRARRDKFIKEAGPAGYPTASFRDNVGYSGSGSTNDAITEMIGLDVILQQITITEEERDFIDKVLEKLEPADRDILRMWYIDRIPKDEIAEKLHYESRTTVYQMRNKAVYEFSILYFGSSAIRA